MVASRRNAGVAYLGEHAFSSFAAWAIWLGVHILNLIGFCNRLLVLINWAWDYLFYERSVRLIMPPERYWLRSNDGMTPKTAMPIRRQYVTNRENIGGDVPCL